MNHVKNIKEMLSISTGNSGGSLSRNVATNGYSSLTDSQLFFGSQSWLENSQGTSQDLSLSSKNSQQSSQEGSDSKFLNSYHTKPLLFGDYKDKNKSCGLLGKFEEEKEKAKEKIDRDLLAKESQHIREALINIKQLVTSAEANKAVCQTVFEKMNNIESTLENNLNLLQRDISQKFETLVDKVNSQKQVLTELEEKVQKNGETTTEFDSHLQSLKNSLQCLREEQERERCNLEEALKLLNTVVSEHSAKRNTKGVMDSAIQTSPQLEPSVSNTLQDDKAKGCELTCASNSHQAKAFPQYHKHVAGRRKTTLSHRRRSKKRALVLPQKSKCRVSDENSQPVKDCSKQQKIVAPLRERCNQNKFTNQLNLNSASRMPPNRGSRSGETAGCLIRPVSYWSADSSSPECLAGIEPILEKLVGQHESNMESPVNAGGLWQLFESE